MPDLVVLDLMMPEMDGFEFLTYLRQSEQGRRVPVVVVTAKAVTAADRARLSGQVKSIFHKGSFTRAELIAELRRVLVTGRPADSPGPGS
jgi:CheY-like chemotaxis protein